MDGFLSKSSSTWRRALSSTLTRPFSQHKAHPHLNPLTLIRQAGLSFNDAVQMATMAAMQDMSYAPPVMQPVIKRMLSSHPHERPTIMDYLACEFFHDMQAKCLQFLEAFPEKDKATKAQFLKQLTSHLDTFERRVLQQKVLPTLLD